jgi:hypothetical protein
MDASLPSDPAGTTVGVFDDDRFDAFGEFADRAVSLWISIREAAYRRERPTLETHCRQVRILTLAAFETVKQLGADPREKAPIA